MTTHEKINFRATKAFKEFRLDLIAKANKSCQLCGTKYSGKQLKRLNCHHLDPENYTDLSQEKFKILCSSCHDDLVERLVIKLNGSNYKAIPNPKAWHTLLKDYLPYKIEKKLSEIIEEGTKNDI